MVGRVREGEKAKIFLFSLVDLLRVWRVWITYHRTNCVLIEWVIPDAQNAREDRSGGSAIIESRIGTGGRVARSLLVPLFAVGVVSECRRVQGGNTVIYACL